MNIVIKEYIPPFSFFNNDLPVNEELIKEIEHLRSQNETLQSGNANAFDGIPALEGIIDGLELFNRAKAIIASNEERIDDLETVVFNNSIAHEFNTLAELHKVSVDTVREIHRVAQSIEDSHLELSDKLNITNAMLSVYTYGASKGLSVK